QHGIGALYAGPEHAERTWRAASQFTETGGVGLFTRPATEMKCAGAPLKHTFLIEDIASRGGAAGRYEMHYAAPQPVLFSVPIVSEKVRMLFGARGIRTHMGQTLKAIDPGRRIAIFEATATDAAGASTVTTTEMQWDYLHVIPPQRAPEVIRSSGLGWGDLWVDLIGVAVVMQSHIHPL